jgi:hypothetical protein
MARIPITSQIAEVRREIALRTNTYPRLIASGKMREGEADLCLDRMRAVLATLNFCQKHEAAIRAYIEGKTPGGAA